MTRIQMLRQFAVAVFLAPIGALYPSHSLAQGTPSSTPIDVAIAKAEAARATSARTYSSIVDVKQTGDESSEIQWRVEFAEPDRFHVRQAAAGLYDEWITIGENNYRSFGVGWSTQSNEEPGLNRFFRVEKFLRVLATAEPIAARESVSTEGRTIMLDYRVTLGPDFTFLAKGATKPGEVRIWIDERTHQVVQGEVVVESRANGKNFKGTVEQSFTGYGAPIQIEAPPTQPAVAQKLPDRSGPEQAEPLDAYVLCQYGAGLSVVSTTRLPGQGVRYRTVATSSGEKKISVVDGYSLMVGQGEPSYFANMKVEKSDPSQYVSDKDAAIKSLEFAMQQSSTGKAVWEHTPYNSFDVYGVNDPTMSGNGPNGIYVLFRDSTQTIVTIYFLGQKPEYRKFKTIEEHDALRDHVLAQLTTCANRSAPANRPASVGVTRDFPPLRTPDDFDAFVNKYYLQPQPDRIGSAIETLSSSGVLRIPEAVESITAFFSEVFGMNPTRVAEWQQVIDKAPPITRVVLGRALSWSRTGGVLQLEGRSPEMNNRYWGAFFASGNALYVKKLLDLVPFAEERNDFNLWAPGASAKWSLASNARQHVHVHVILEEEKNRADKRTQELIDELLSRDPARIGQEMADIYAKQKAAGKWK
jgi:hypothetical protein